MPAKVQSGDGEAVVGEPNRILRLGMVINDTGLSRATIYRMMAAGAFPRQVALGARAVGWRERDIAAFIENLKTVSPQ